MTNVTMYTGIADLDIFQFLKLVGQVLINTESLLKSITYVYEYVCILF